MLLKRHPCSHPPPLPSVACSEQSLCAKNGVRHQGRKEKQDTVLVVQVVGFIQDAEAEDTRQGEQRGAWGGQPEAEMPCHERQAGGFSLCPVGTGAVLGARRLGKHVFVLSGGGGRRREEGHRRSSRRQEN